MRFPGYNDWLQPQKRTTAPATPSELESPPPQDCSHLDHDWSGINIGPSSHPDIWLVCDDCLQAMERADPAPVERSNRETR